MTLFKLLTRVLYNNGYLLFGVVIGLYISTNFTDLNCDVSDAVTHNPSRSHVPSDSSRVPPANLILRKKAEVDGNKTGQHKNQQTKKPVRPRYYSTELGIKEKLFVGVLSSEEKINNQAVYINKTIAHLVDKVKFFLTAQQNIKNRHNLSGIVGFTGTRQAHRPFQVVKYIGDSFIQDYDYYYLVSDHNYLNARKLRRVVAKVSVSLNVYMGVSVKDGSYCDFNSGILLSNSVMKAMLDNLDWCVKNAVSEEFGENFGRCVHHSTKLSCQEVVQGQTLPTYKLKRFELENDLAGLREVTAFKEAITVYPVLQKTDFYLLHAFFTKQQLSKTVAQINELSESLTDQWPRGQRVGTKPATRFDLAPRHYFNMTHMFFPDDYTNVRAHTASDADDIQRVVRSIVSKVLYQKPNDFQYSRLINGYRTFQLSRGLDYQVDLAFRDLHTGKEVVKRFEVCKPLAQVEFLSKPYTTENGRVTVLLPVEEGDLNEAARFLEVFATSVMDRREKVLLMLVFLYRYNATSKGAEDVYRHLKEVATGVTRKHRSEDTKVAWVSVRLPVWKGEIRLEEFPSLSFAMADLALRKVGVDDLVLVADVRAQFTVEFLNRVRMNTITGFQVFSPIPFRQYHPQITQVQTLDVNKRAGQFDREEYKYISFYARDYIQARKKFNATLPIVKSDNDIATVLQNEYKGIGNVFEMFLKFSTDLHCMRATEPALKVKYHEETHLGRGNLFLGNKAQMAKLILDHEAKAALS